MKIAGKNKTQSMRKQEKSGKSSDRIMGSDQINNHKNHQDSQLFEDEKPSRDISSTDKERQDGSGTDVSYLSGIKDVTILKQLPKALELVSSLPLEYRSKVRQIIKAYEDDRKKYQIQIRRLHHILVKHHNRQQKEQHLQQKPIEIYKPSHQDLQQNKPTDQVPILALSLDSLLYTDKTIEQLPFRVTNQQKLKSNQFAQFLQEEFNNTQLTLSQQIDSLKTDVNTKVKQLTKQQQKIKLLVQKIRSLESEVKSFTNDIKTITQKNKWLQKTVEEAQLSLSHNEACKTVAFLDTSNINIDQLKIPQQQQEVRSHRRSFHVSRKRNASASSDRSLSSRYAKGSLRNQIQKSKMAMDLKQQQGLSLPSQCDSTEFGKQKVIQKKKLRKFFTNLLSSSNYSQKKQIIDKLAGQIGFKAKDIDSLFKKD